MPPSVFPLESLRVDSLYGVPSFRALCPGLPRPVRRKIDADIAATHSVMGGLVVAWR